MTRDRDLQKPVEFELKGLGFFLTHRVSPSVARFPASEPRKARLDACSAGQGTTTKSEIRVEVMEGQWTPKNSVVVAFDSVSKRGSC